MRNILLLLMLFPVMNYASQIEQVHKSFDKIKLEMSNINQNKIYKEPYIRKTDNYFYGVSNLFKNAGIYGEKIKRLTYSRDDIIIDSTLIIDYDTTIYSNIILIGDAQLIVRNCAFQFKGNLYAMQNSLFSVDNCNFIVHQDFLYQYMFVSVDSAKIEINNSTFNSSNLPINGAVVNKGSFSMDSVDMNGAFITFGLYDNGIIDIRYSNRAGEFVVLGDSSLLNIAHSDTVLLWLGFPENSSGELNTPPDTNEWVEQFSYPDITCTGINYSVNIDSLYGLMIATMAKDSTDVTITNAHLRASGNIFEMPITDTITGIIDYSYYNDWVAPFEERNYHLINSSVDAWNLYFFGAGDMTIKSSIFGECLSAGMCNTTLMNTTCDGSGGHIGASDSSMLTTFYTSLYTDALLESKSISFFILTNFTSGHLIARNSAINIMYNTVLANPIQVYDSATVIVTGLYPPSPAYVDDTISIAGSALMVKAPGSIFQYEGYKLEYAPTEDTMAFYSITDIIPEQVSDSELGKFITDSLDVGSYILRLWYYYSVSGIDSLSFDNSIYLSYNSGIANGDISANTPFSIRSLIYNDNIKIEYGLSQSSDIEIVLYNLNGQKIYTIYKGFKTKGKYDTIYNIKNLSKGVYFCSLKINDKLYKSIKFIK